MEISSFDRQEKVQPLEKLCLHFRGLTPATAGTLSREGFDGESAVYSEMMCDKLQPTVRSKHRGLLSRGLVFLYDSARPQTAVRTVENLRN